MEIIEKRLNELTPYKNNPRKNDQAVDAVAASIKAFGFKVPIVIDRDGVIVCGHTRAKAAKKLKLESVPCVVADDLTEEEIKAFRLADNKVSEKALWDDELLRVELDGLADFDMEQFGFDALGPFVNDDKYTKKIEPPVYECKRNCPDITSLCNTTKYEELLKGINKSNIPEDVKAFLRLAAARHIVFEFSEIAEYYAHQPKEIQELMEESGLVIIDYNKAIEKGFVKMTSLLEGLFDEA